MSRLPYMQFYFADWRNNSNLRRCSHAARGALLDLMGVMHDSDEYGVVRWPLKELAAVAGVPLKLAKELVEKNVLKGSDNGIEAYIFRPTHARRKGDPIVLLEASQGPCWYSSRMVRDAWRRSRQGAGTRFDSENNPARNEAKELAESPDTERARLRARVLEKTVGHCFHCQCELGATWEIDHLVPRSKGGDNQLSNLVPSCVQCNRAKADTLPGDWAAPNHSPIRRVGDNSSERQGVAPNRSPSSCQRQRQRQIIESERRGGGSDEGETRDPTLETPTDDQAPALEQIIAYGATAGVPPETCEWFFNDMEASGWRNRHGQPIRKWQPLLMNVNARRREGDHLRRQTAARQRPTVAERDYAKTGMKSTAGNNLREL